MSDGLPHVEMLTVRKLIEYLKTQDPDANILAYEPNSRAYIEQFPDLPNLQICTVAEDKVREETFARGWFRGDLDLEKKVKDHLEETYRYAKDTDIVLNF